MRNKIDKLERIFHLQKSFGKLFTDFNNKNLKYKEERTKHFILAMIEEAIELLRTINHKEWKLKKFEPNISKLKEEIADITHFLVTIALIWGMTPSEFFIEYYKKNQENWKRKKEKY